jgi:hypothetical protein
MTRIADAALAKPEANGYTIIGQWLGQTLYRGPLQQIE